MKAKEIITKGETAAILYQIEYEVTKIAADKRCVSEHTQKNQIMSAMAKYGVNTQIGLVKEFMKYFYEVDIEAISRIVQKKVHEVDLEAISRVARKTVYTILIIATMGLTPVRRSSRNINVRTRRRFEIENIIS